MKAITRGMRRPEGGRTADAESRKNPAATAGKLEELRSQHALHLSEFPYCSLAPAPVTF